MTVVSNSPHMTMRGPVWLATFAVAPLDDPPGMVGLESQPDRGESVAVQLASRELVGDVCARTFERELATARLSVVVPAGALVGDGGEAPVDVLSELLGNRLRLDRLIVTARAELALKSHLTV